MESNDACSPVDAGTGAKPMYNSYTPLGNTWELLEAAVQRAKTQSDLAHKIGSRLEAVEARIISVESDVRTKFAVLDDLRRSSTDMREKCQAVMEQSTKYCTESYIESLLAQCLDKLKVALVDVLKTTKTEAGHTCQMLKEADMLRIMKSGKTSPCDVVPEGTIEYPRLIDMVKKLQESNACLIACTTQQRELVLSMNKKFEDDIENVRKQLDCNQPHVVLGKGSTSVDTKPTEAYSQLDETTTSVGSCSPPIEAHESPTKGFTEAVRNQAMSNYSPTTTARQVLGRIATRNAIPSVIKARPLRTSAQSSPPVASVVCARGRSLSSQASDCDISDAGDYKAQVSNLNVSRAEKWFRARSGSQCSAASDRTNSVDQAIPSSACSVQSSVGAARKNSVLALVEQLESRSIYRSTLKGHDAACNPQLAFPRSPC